MTRLEWDSSFFGLEVYRAILGDQDRLGGLKGDLVYLFDRGPKFENSQRWHELGIDLLDSKLTFHKSIHSTTSTSNEEISVLDRLTDELVDLAIQSSVESRYRKDPRLEQQCDELYLEWIKNSLSGKLASEVLGYFSGTKLIGMVTYKVEDETAKIGLIAVDIAYRGQGVGLTLLEEVERRSRKLGARKLEVVTQSDNLGAVKFYKSFGFRVKSEVRIHHYWKDEHKDTI